MCRYLAIYFVAVILGAHLDELAIDSLEDVEDVTHQCCLTHLPCRRSGWRNDSNSPGLNTKSKLFFKGDVKQIQPRLHKADDVHSPSLQARTAFVEAEGPGAGRVVGAATAEDGEQFEGRDQANREPSV